MSSSELWRRLLYPFRQRQFDLDLEEEMRFHLEMAAEQSGIPAARRKFGNMALLQEDARAAWGWTAVETWAADLKYAVRGLRRSPGFTAVVLLTMALGIGSTTAIFSVVHSVLLRPLPFREPERLAAIWQTDVKNQDRRSVVSYPMFRAWQQGSSSFEHIGAWDGDSVTMMVAGEPTEAPGAAVSPGFFEALNTKPLLGTFFTPEEHHRGASDVAILSYGLWRRLGGDAGIVGKAVQFDRRSLRVAGVMPKEFVYPEGWAELWLPHTVEDSRNRGARYLKIVGRLRPGVTASQARAELEAIAARQDEILGATGANVIPLDEEMVGRTRRVLVVLMGAGGCVFLIACANVANLLLVRATGRRRDLALRLALGAGRWRVARSFLAESVLLAVGGGVAGVTAAYWLVRLFVAADPARLPRSHEIAVDGTVLLYAAVAAVVTGIAFGLAPALQSTRPELANWLKEGALGSGEFGQNRSRGILAAAQIAFAVILLVGAGLLLRSFVAQLRVPLGFNPHGSIGAALPWSANRGIEELTARLRALPGVTAAGAATAFPQQGAYMSCDQCLEVEGRPRPKGKPGSVGLVSVTAGYFQAAGMRLAAGRFFTTADGKDAPKVAVINQAMARRDFPADDPIGKRLGHRDNHVTIVGVVGDVKGFGAALDPMATVYFPHAQYGWYNPVKVLVKTAVPSASLTNTVRKEIRAWNPRLVIEKLDTLDNLMASDVATPRFYLLLMAGFAALALAVSAVGVYGTVNYSVARRMHEIGVRIALGAERSDVLAIVLRQGLALTAAGIALGLVGAWAAARVLETLLFGIRPTDGIAFAGGSGVLLIAALLACYIPARRATRVDPLVALRHE